MKYEQQNQLAYIYAYLATICDINGKIYDEFVPLIEYYLFSYRPHNHETTFEILQSGINDLYGINIPKATLIKLLKSMETRQLINISNNKIRILTYAGENDYLASRNDIDLRLQNLYASFSNFLTLKGVESSTALAKEVILDIVYKNSLAFSQFFGYNTKVAELQSFSSEESQHFLEFFNDILIKNEELKHTFAQLLIGAQKTAILNLKPSQIQESKAYSKIIEQLWLDSNFVLRLLGMQEPFNCSVAKDTFNFLKAQGVKFYILSDTIVEMTHSINNYLGSSSHISKTTRQILNSSTKRFSGFFAAENSGNFTRTKFITCSKYSCLESEIKTLGIEVVEDNSLQYKPALMNSLIESKNRDTYSDENAIHDLKLIARCEKARKLVPINKRDTIWVLTNDSKLTKWNKTRQADNNVCITELQICSLFWLTSTSNNDLIVNQAVAALSDIHAWGIQEITEFQQKFYTHAKTANANLDQLNALAHYLVLDGDSIIDAFDNENYSEVMNNLMSSIAEVENSQQIKEENTKLIEISDSNKKSLESRIDELGEEYSEKEQILKQAEESFNITKMNLKHAITLLRKSRCVLAAYIVPLIIILIVGITLISIYYESTIGIIGIIVTIFPLVACLIYILCTTKRFSLNAVVQDITSRYIKKYKSKNNIKINIQDLYDIKPYIIKCNESLEQLDYQINKTKQDSITIRSIIEELQRQLDNYK